MSAVQDLTRAELSWHIGNAMEGTADRGRFGFRLKKGNVRTFALEVNLPDRTDPLSQVDRVAFDLGMELSPTADAALAVVGDENDGMFVDVVDPRFWLVHTTGASSWLDRALARLVSHRSDIDWCWFPLSMLQEMQREGRTRWFKSDFRGDELLPLAGVRARRLKIQLEGDDAEELHRHIAAYLDYGLSASLTGITMEIDDNELGTLSAAAHYRGSFSGRGRSFALHQAFVGRAISGYASKVRDAEQQLAISWSVEDGRAVFAGHPIEIRLSRPIADLERFANGLFAARDPFRLWAIPRRASRNVVEAEAVDLHVGQVLRIDVTTNRLLVHLPAGTCANTVMRLVANLQHRYDAQASAVSPLGTIA